MKITVNGRTKEFTHSANLQEIIDQFCRDTKHVIAEVNGQIIKSPSWTESALRDGDVVELVNFVGGG